MSLTSQWCDSSPGFSSRVTCTPPSLLGDTTGYRISYTEGGGSSDGVDVDGGNNNSHSLMGLTNGETCTPYHLWSQHHLVYPVH